MCKKQWFFDTQKHMDQHAISSTLINKTVFIKHMKHYGGYYSLLLINNYKNHSFEKWVPNENKNKISKQSDSMATKYILVLTGI